MTVPSRSGPSRSGPSRSGPSRSGHARAKARTLFAAAAVATTAVALAVPAAASAATAHDRSTGTASGPAVFVQTDNTAGNQVVAYQRSGDGKLTLAGTYPTGGLGGQLTGSVVDHLASQGSLQYDAQQHMLIAVNAGSNSVTVFGVHGTRLHQRQIIGSGGQFPVSVAIRGNLMYVVNALRGGSVQGYRLSPAGRLAFLRGSHRRLHLSQSATPQFTNTPGQVAFSPSGSQLIVTTKANGNDIDVFGVRPSGRLSVSPVVNSEDSTVPFAIAFDQAGHLVIANAGTNSLSTFTLGSDGTVTLIDSVGTGQAATCWVALAGGTLYASNAGSANVSGYTSSASGQLTLLGQTATDPGTVDAAATPAARSCTCRPAGTASSMSSASAPAGHSPASAASPWRMRQAARASPLPDRSSPSPAGGSGRPPGAPQTGRPRLSAVDSDTDAQLLAALRAGDERAFVTLVHRHHAAMLRLASSFVPNVAVAEEVVQDTWVGVLRGIGGFEGRSSFRTWLFRILVNRARTAGARERRTIAVGDTGAVSDTGAAVAASQVRRRRQLAFAAGAVDRGGGGPPRGRQAGRPSSTLRSRTCPTASGRS